MNLDEYVDYYVQSVETKHRVRSILGLAALGGQDANRALQKAGSLPLNNYEKSHLARVLSDSP